MWWLSYAAPEGERGEIMIFSGFFEFCFLVFLGPSNLTIETYYVRYQSYLKLSAIDCYEHLSI